MKKYSIQKIILVILGVGAIAILGYKVYQGFKQNLLALKEDLPSTYTLPFDVESLISNKYLGQLRVKEVYQSKVRNPISVVSFNEKYQIIITKIDLRTKDSLRNILQFNEKRSDRTTGFSYSIFGKFQRKAGKVDSTSKIIFALDGSSLTETDYSQNALGYHLYCNNFSIKYSENTPVDIFFIGEELPLGITRPAPCDILFLNRNNSTYLFVMTPESDNDPVPFNLLYSMIK